MKTLLLLASLSFVSPLAHASDNCTTSEGVKFSAVYNASQDLECNTDYLVIAGVKIVAPARDECSNLSNFRGSDGTKLALFGNGLGTLFYKGKLVSVNCD
jgi:hypothetical protein